MDFDTEIVPLFPKRTAFFFSNYEDEEDPSRHWGAEITPVVGGDPWPWKTGLGFYAPTLYELLQEIGWFITHPEDPKYLGYIKLKK
jgi:hypothetical protein